MRITMLGSLPAAGMLLLVLLGCARNAQPAGGPTDGRSNEFVLTDANFEDEVLQSTQPVLVDFWAASCAPCLEMKPMIREVAEEYLGRIKVGELDIESNGFFVAKYRIEPLPALLLFQNGEPVARLEGFQTKEELVRWLEKLIAPADARDKSKPQRLALVMHASQSGI